YNTAVGDDPNADSFGELITYTIQVDFNDAVNYENVVIRDTLPSGLEFVSQSYNITNALTTVTPNHSGKNLVWNLSNFNGLETVQINYDVRIIDEGQVRGNDLTNQAKMSFDINTGGEIFNFPDSLIQDAETFTLKEPVTTIVSRSPASGSMVIAGQEIDHILIVENNAANESNVSQAYECIITETIDVGGRLYDPTTNLVVKKYNDSGLIAALTKITDYTSSYNSGTGIMTITLKNTAHGILQDKDYFQISYKTKIDDGVAAGATIQHTAQLVSYSGQPSTVTGVELYAGNSISADYSTVQSNSSLVVEDPVDREIKPGDIATLQASITIPKGTSVYDLNLESNLPTGLSYVNGSSVGLNNGGSTYRNLTPTVSGTPDTGEKITWASEVDNQDITNDTGSDLTLTLTFDAVVLDSSFINDGDTKTADFVYNYNIVNDTGSSRTSYSPVTVNLNVIEPDLTVSMDITSTGSYQAGDTVSYRLTITNPSTETAYDVRITDLLPDNLTLKSTPTFESGSALFNQTGQELSWGSDDNLDIAPTGTVVINIDAILDLEVEPEEVIQNNLTVTWESQDGTIANERSYTHTLPTPVEISVTDNSALSRSLTSTPTYVIGETIDCQLVLTLNKGTTDNVVVTDILAGGVEFVSASITPDGTGSVQYTLNQQPSTGNTGTITWNFGRIVVPATESNTITIDYTVRILNVAVNNANDAKTLSAVMNYNNSADTNKGTLPQDHNFAIKEPVLVVEQSYPPGNYDAGDTITYTIKVWHDSTSAPYDVSAYDVEISNPIPLGMSYVNGSMSPAGVHNAGTLTWNIPEIDSTHDIGNPFTLTYDLTLADSVEPRELLSENTDLSWTSLSGIVSGERDASGGLNDY
ncbi:MAG: DUF11 domain-containing protein, partial [Desulfovibrionales bacterium]|nr:DUF11 domain-containing protein [Desulfovibrionales bacterium]